MEFGYFTLSDNHYDNNPRTPNQFVADITAEALYADTARHALGLDRRASFQLARRALLPRPRAGLYRRAHQAHPPRAGGHRAAAAPSDPRRRAMGDARPALQRPRRFRRRPRLRPARIRAVPRLVRRQPGHLRGRPRAGAKLWAAEGRISHHGKHYSFEDVRITPKPVQKPIPTYVALVLQALDRACRAARLRPDRRAVRRRHELRRA